MPTHSRNLPPQDSGTTTYHLYSQHPKVYNYVSPTGALHCLSLPSVGAGPGLTTVSHLPEPAPLQLVVKTENGDRQVLQPTGLAIIDTSDFDPRLPPAIVCPRSSAALQRVVDCLSPLIPGTVCSALPGHTPSEKPSQLQQAMQDRIMEGLTTLSAGAYADGARQLRGVGPGLTPAGDDILSGFLWALSAGDRQWEEARRTLYEHSIGDNPISNHILQAAWQGHFFEHVKAVVVRIVERLSAAGTDNEDSALRSSCQKLLEHGATSGADTLAGLLHGWQHMMRR